MKILYIASIRLPTEKAHGVQIMKTCEAISLTGTNISLFVPKFFSLNSNNEDPFEYYGVKKIFVIKRFFSLRLIKLGPIGFFLETSIFFISILFSTEFWRSDYIFSRDEMLVAFSNVFGKKTIWETHTGSTNFFAKIALKKSKIIISISKGLKDFYVKLGSQDSKIVVSHDGVDPNEFIVSDSKIDLRKKLDISVDKKIVLYAGRLDGWKGVETFLESSLGFSRETLAVVVGGDDNQIKFLSEKYPKVLFMGYKSYKELPMYQKLADVLIVPNTGKSEISRFFTSPLKVFSYMASGVPIVASDLPSIREILNNQNSVLVLPDSPQALLEGINRVLEDTSLAGIIAKQALLDVHKYSWGERAKVIISSLVK